MKKKEYAILYNSAIGVIADIEVDKEDESAAMKQFQRLGIDIPAGSSIRFSNKMPFYYGRGGKTMGGGGLTDESFLAEIDAKNIDVWGLPAFLKNKGVDFNESFWRFTVQYDIHPDFRKWGLKSIDVSIINIVGDIEWEAMDLDSITQEERGYLIAAGGISRTNKYYHEEYIEGVIEIDTTTTQKDWEIVNEVKSKENGSTSVSGLEIDLEKKTITVT